METKMCYAVFNTSTALMETGETVIKSGDEFRGSFYQFHAGGEFVIQDFPEPIEDHINKVIRTGNIIYALSETSEKAQAIVEEAKKV